MGKIQDHQEANNELEEYAYLQNFMDAESLSIHVIEDNKNKRVILLEDANDTQVFEESSKLASYTDVQNLTV